MDGRRPHGGGAQSRYWNKGKPHLDRVVLRPLPDLQSRFASLKSGETDVVWVDEFEADNIVRAQKDPTLQVLSHKGRARR